MESKLFSPVTFGPLTLRNRTIRSAAFESMCPENTPTQMLLDYHRSVAAGGVGMTTVAYAAVTQSGLSFDRQLWLRPSIIPRLHELTKAVHDEGAAVGIQIGHCGNMSHKNICGVTPISASSGFNLYSPTFVRGMEKEELPEMAKAYGNAVNLARKAGFDAVEVHAGHGYLISQFLSPYTNHRKDEYARRLQRRNGDRRIHTSGQTSVGTWRSWIGVEWWFCQQSADVCNERCHADSFDVLLYELLVAEIRSPYVWQMDDTLCALQRGLFP